MTAVAADVDRLDPSLVEAVRRRLEPVASSPWAEVAWRFSLLTGNGYPMEWAFTSDGGSHATVEVAGPEVDHHDRLVLAAATLPAPSRRHLTAVVAAQRGHELRWGAWLGIRVRDGREDNKVYAELPDGRPLQRLPVPIRSEARLVGADARGRVEHYFRTNGLDEVDLHTLFRDHGGADRVAEVRTLISQCANRPAADVLSSRQVGYSVTLDDHGRVECVALLVAARVLCTGDQRVRSQVLAVADRAGWDLARYEAMSRPLADGDRWHGHVHGIAAFAASTDHPLQFQIGLRPISPEVSP